MPNQQNPPALKLLQLAAASLRAGRDAEAEAQLRMVLAHDPVNSLALNHLALLAYNRGHAPDALSLLKNALGVEPKNLPVLTTYATMLHEMGRSCEALDVFLQILAVDPTPAEIWNAAGICLQETDQPAKAVEFYLRAIGLRKTFAEPYSNLGAVLTNEGDLDAAMDHFKTALALDPEFADCHSNLGVALRGRFEYATAIQSFREAFRLKPESADIAGSLGEVLSLVYDEAAEPMLRRSVEMQPDDPEKHWNYALELLKQGDYAAGWREYEWRWQRPKNQNPLRPMAQPFWRGEEIRGKTLLLHAEQGFGDTLQFLRYIPELLGRCAHVVLEVPLPLKRIAEAFAQQFPGKVQVAGWGEPLPPFDWHLPTMSLPMACGTTVETVPPARRFTPLPQRRTSQGTLRIGLAWSGNPHHNRDRERSIPLEALMPLFAVPRCSWVSLQVGPAALAMQQAGVAIEQPVFGDFFDTATVIDTLDLVLSVDSAVAHLAASQGAPTWILLPFVADWRWLKPSSEIVSEANNPWYPKATILRQTVLPNGESQAELWKPVITEVAARLLEMMRVSAAETLPSPVPAISSSIGVDE